MEERLEPAEVAALYAHHADELRNFLTGVLRDPSLVQDVLQATFVKLLERGSDAAKESRKSWMFQVAFNQAREIRRKGANQQRILREKVAAPEPTLDGPGDHFVRFERVEQVQQAIATLPAKQQEVVRLRVYEEKKFKEIAELLQLPLGTVLSRMRSAVENLRKVLDDLQDDN